MRTLIELVGRLFRKKDFLATEGGDLLVTETGNSILVEK